VSFTKPLEKQVPFSIELKQESFQCLEKLLAFSQQIKDDDIKEVMLSSCLFLLKMQVHYYHLLANISKTYSL